MGLDQSLPRETPTPYPTRAEGLAEAQRTAVLAEGHGEVLSAALDYLDALTVGRTPVRLRQYDEISLAEERIEHALSVFQEAASRLADIRAERRAAERES